MKTEGETMIENATSLAKGVKTLVKENKELAGLVFHMRGLLEDCMRSNGEPIDYSNKKLERAFVIMMEIQHEKDLAKEKKNDNLHVQGGIAFGNESEPSIDEFYGDEEI